MLATILSYFTSKGMKKILATVQCLSLITHLMQMDLKYPGGVLVFFSGVFGLAKFDVIPKATEILQYIFTFGEKNPLNENLNY